MTIKPINVQLPKRLDIPTPARIGPSAFPGSVDQLKLINYSAVPAGGQIEHDLRNYYTLLAKVASNTASEEELLSLKALMVRIREYVVTEDDFNLMSDAVRTTQEFLLAALDQESNNFTAITQVMESFATQLNNWSEAWQKDLNNAQTKGTALGAPVVFGAERPTTPAGAFGYLWVNNEVRNDFVAPDLSWDPDFPVGPGGLGSVDGKPV